MDIIGLCENQYYDTNKSRLGTFDRIKISRANVIFVSFCLTGCYTDIVLS